MSEPTELEPMPDLSVWRDVLRGLQVAVLFLLLVTAVSIGSTLKAIAERPEPTVTVTNPQATECQLAEPYVVVGGKCFPIAASAGLAPEVWEPILPTVGGSAVPPGLQCAEDSVIGFVGIDRLGCVHVEGNVLEP